MYNAYTWSNHVNDNTLQRKFRLLLLINLSTIIILIMKFDVDSSLKNKCVVVNVSTNFYIMLYSMSEK